MNCVTVLVAPEPDSMGAGQFFYSWPSAFPGSLTLRSHSEFYRKMLSTMKRDFVPPIDGAFDARDVLDLCENNAVPKSFQAYALAAFNAYFGNDKTARCWCARFSKLINEPGLPWDASDHRRKAFLDSLERWLDEGIAKSQLEQILAAEKIKWGLR